MFGLGFVLLLLAWLGCLVFAIFDWLAARRESREEASTSCAD